MSQMVATNVDKLWFVGAIDDGYQTPTQNPTQGNVIRQYGLAVELTITTTFGCEASKLRSSATDEARHGVTLDTLLL